MFCFQKKRIFKNETILLNLFDWQKILFGEVKFQKLVFLISIQHVKKKRLNLFSKLSLHTIIFKRLEFMFIFQILIPSF